MLPYRYNQRSAINPFLGERFWGHAILPGLSAVRVDPGGGLVPCLTQVAEVPWSEDEAGVEIDQDNSWAVRTVCGADPDGGEIEWWTIVPRQLDPAYTPVGRCGRIVPLIANHLGDNPFLGVVSATEFGYATRPVRWRTPTGQYPPDLEDEGYLWVPMNLNQQVLDVYDAEGGYLNFGYTEAGNSGVATGFDGPGCSIGYTAGPNMFRDWGYAAVGRHVGFRGGKAILRLYSNRTCPIASTEAAGDVRMVIGWSDTTPATDELPPNIVFDETYTFTDLAAVGPGVWYGIYYGQRWELVIDLPPLLVPITEAEPKHWVFFLGSCMAGFVINLDSVRLSPRHDIPLWYWASQRNRIAPGGILLP